MLVFCDIFGNIIKVLSTIKTFGSSSAVERSPVEMYYAAFYLKIDRKRGEFGEAQSYNKRVIPSQAL